MDKKRYWAFMTQKRSTIYYLSCYLEKSVLIERIYNISLAIVSTGALACLLASDTCQIISAIIIMLAQVASAAKPYMPFAKRSEQLSRALPLFENIYIEIEEHWNEVEVADKNKINEIYYDYDKKWESVKSNLLVDDALPKNPDFENIAEAKTIQYFKNFLGEE